MKDDICPLSLQKLLQKKGTLHNEDILARNLQYALSRFDFNETIKTLKKEDIIKWFANYCGVDEECVEFDGNCVTVNYDVRYIKLELDLNEYVDEEDLE